MTQDEIIEMARQTGWHDALLDVSFVLPMLTDFAKLVSAKAIAELESQEPVAWVAEDICKGQIIYGRPRKIWWECEKGVGKAFYTHPLQRTWVGLTDEEIEERQEEFEEIEDMPFSQNDWLWFYTRAIEAKLKEKNT